MKRSPLPLLFAMLLCAPLTAPAVVYYWTGIGNGWKDQIAPTGTGGESVVFIDTLGRTVVLPGGAAPVYNSLTFQRDDDFTFLPASPLTLTLAGGMSFPGSGSAGNKVTFNSNVTLALSQAQVWNAMTNLFVVSGRVTGTGPLTLRVGNNANGYTGFFNFNNPAAVNDYTGGTTIDMVGDGSNGVGGVAFWNNTPFGNGNVAITNGAFFASHTTLAPLANNFTLTSSSTNRWNLRNWDAPLTLSGDITLASNAFIAPQFAYTGLPASNSNGEYPMPGPLTRFPTVITGTVSGAYSLTVLGQGILILNPSTQNTYSGGTIVNNGALVFGSNLAIPAAGTIFVNTQGYAGFGDVSGGHFASQFLAAVNKTSAGTIGVDTLPGDPTVTLGDIINLSSTGTGATSFTNAGIRLGTATSAILTGGITPQGTSYQFGGGGGALYVQTSLGDAAGNGVYYTGRQLNSNGSATILVPLKLYLQGANSYAGGTATNNGFIIFDGSSSVPSIGFLTAATTNTTTPSLGVGGSYIGYSDSVGTTSTAFLAKFDKTNTWGIVGFDTHAGNSTATYTNVNLTGFNNGVFIGTSSSAILGGTLTPSTVTNANNAANTLRVTAGNGGTLTVASNLGGGLGIIVGSPAYTPAFSDGTVVLSGTNTYTGGTTLNTNSGITLALDNSAALGTGNLTVATTTGFMGQAALSTTVPGLVISNNIVFETSDYTNNSPSTLVLAGTNSYTLSGNISSGPIVPGNPLNSTPAGIFLNNASPLAVTLIGNNSGYFGDIDVANGTLTLANNTAGINNAAGRGTLSFDSSAANVVFSGGATTEVIYGIHGESGSLTLPGGSNLVINTNNSGVQGYNFEFGGVISESGGSASLSVSSTASNDLLYLYGHNTYTGGTTITGYSVLGLGQNDSAGSGFIILNALHGGLALNTGVTLANGIQFSSGGLAGLGTFAPTNVNGDTSGTRTITIGSNQLVFPGIPGADRDIPGKLTFSLNTAFGNGGKFQLDVQDPNSAEGRSLLAIGGGLDLTSLSTGGFTLALTSLDAAGHLGFANTIVWGQSYTFAFVQATGGITGFDPTDFSVDDTSFQGGILPGSAFSVSSDATHLYLNFTAVPEPSTWALLATGLGLLGLRSWRRRT